MANSTGFVGVPKREPCRKCGNPVFFAERISFEQKLYHRSCLKCARCGTQLTLGSFYETETDGEYCCETCPDEEIQLTARRRSISSEKSAPTANGNRETVRNSRSSKLLERISFFESAPLSDEEKTSNLVRRAQMSSFLKDSLDKGDKPTDDSKAEMSQLADSEDASESEDDSDPEETPPAPPTSEPPALSTPIDSITIDLVNTSNGNDASDVAIENNRNLLDKYENNEEGLENVTSTSGNVNESHVPSASNDVDATTADELNIKETAESDNLHEKVVVLDEKNEKSMRNESIEKDTKIETHEINEAGENDERDEKDERTNECILNNHQSDQIVVAELFESVELEQEQVQQNIANGELDGTTILGNIEQNEVPKDEEHVEETSDQCLENADEVPKIRDDVVSDTILTSNTTGTSEELSTLNKRDSISKSKEEYPSDLNPFGDDSEEDQSQITSKPVPSARKTSTNPFGSDDEDESQPVNSKPPRPPPPKIKPSTPSNPFDEVADDELEHEIVPVIVKPSPRRTPVPTPRKQHSHTDSISSLETSLMSSQFGGSNASLASSMESGPSSMTINRRKKSKAPDIPAITKMSTENLSTNQYTTPRKKRPAPAPPALSSTPKQLDSKSSSPNPTQRLITLDASLISRDNGLSESLSRVPSDESVVYRRTIVPLKVDDDNQSLETTTSERQWEKMKDNKEAQNRNRQSQISPASSQNDSYNSLISNKSQQGKWKRRKGPAPALPVPLPERKTIKMLPLKEIRQELDIIETQQQGLEKQGVILEQMIRERCEGVDPEMDITGIQTNSKEVEDLIMQLFELVNEKNELFRRQAELMYLRRQHRLEQEQADLEYEIRLLMAQPERNKTDSDKEKEEALIARLVEIVQMRNEVVDCLEMDRLREAEEDMSIKQSIEERAANQQKHGKKDSETEKSASGDSSMKLSKKEKKKLKEAKKLVKSKKIDSEKDADETENSTKEKKKKKKFFVDFLHHK